MGGDAGLESSAEHAEMQAESDCLDYTWALGLRDVETRAMVLLLNVGANARNL